MEKKGLGVGGIISIVFAVLNGIGIVASTGCGLFVRGKFLQMYAELGAELPVMTRLFLNFHWGIWIVISAFLLLVLVAKEFIPKKWIPLLLNGLFLFFGLLWWAVFSSALLLPLKILTEQLGTGSPPVS